MAFACTSRTLASSTRASHCRSAVAPSRLFSAGSRRPLVRARAEAESAPSVSTKAAPAAQAPPYKHLLLTILDANSYLSDGTKLGIATACQLASLGSGGKVTVLVVDEEGTTATNPTERFNSVEWHFQDKAFKNYSILEKNISSPSSVLIGDVADDIEADLVLLSAEAVHAKHVNANQLAEFVSCPVLLLP
ncbi:hypothetical protein FOA52_015418 [Chlamydomonas sp. UWO 241]|nr:hypothetical protein FOA52_015418 [Chlamydomonas sp. UWO 241]